jgi:phenylalanyl-tRNA synthetase alpha chain
MQGKEYNISTEEEQKLLKSLEKRDDADAVRMKRCLRMPDLSRTEDSPIKTLIDKVKNVEGLKGFDDIKIPEVVPADVNFDLFNYPPDHPARSKSDTYYVDDKNVLRTQTTVSWYYYLTSDFGKEKVKNNETIGVLSYGKVYRKDEIDRSHMNVFHQIDGWYIIPKEKGIINVEHLKDILVEIVQSVFGKDIKYRFNPDTFPYTDPSLEMEIEVAGKWVEVLGCGVVHPEVLERLGVDSKNYTGWAFGFGLERLAIIGMKLPDIRLLWSEDERIKKQLKLGQKYKEVSKFPPITRDISFIVPADFVANNYFDLIREVVGENLIEEVKMLDKYENEGKLGKDKVSYTYRIIYRSLEKTLTSAEVDVLHKKLERETEDKFLAIIR